MLKRRIIPTLLYRAGQIVKGVGFDSWRHIGSALHAIRVYRLRDVDELCLLDIAAAREGRGPDFDGLARLADHCTMPLAIGGGIRTLEHAERLLRDIGADKVVLGTSATQRPELITEIAARFGSQSVVVSVDARAGQRVEAVALARRSVALGAGEILLQSIDRDGTMQGYDLELIARVSSTTTVPVIASGGAGSYEHMRQAFDAGASACAAGAMFAFTEQTPAGAAKWLGERGVSVRCVRGAA